MKTCGISIKSNVAIICVIEQAKTSIKIVQTSMKKIQVYTKQVIYLQYS